MVKKKTSKVKVNLPQRYDKATLARRLKVDVKEAEVKKDCNVVYIVEKNKQSKEKKLPQR